MPSVVAVIALVTQPNSCHAYFVQAFPPAPGPRLQVRSEGPSLVSLYEKCSLAFEWASDPLFHLSRPVFMKPHVKPKLSSLFSVEWKIH